MVSLLLSWLLAVPLPAVAGPHRAAVLDLLNAFEGAPTAEDLRAIDPGVDAELREIADDEAVPTSRRGRAISALAHFPSDPNQAFLEARLDKADRPLLRRKAAGALGAGFGDRALPALGAELDDPDAQVRLAVVNALAAIGSAPAKALLKERLDGEREPSVRAAIEGALAAGGQP